MFSCIFPSSTYFWPRNGRVGMIALGNYWEKLGTETPVIWSVSEQANGFLLANGSLVDGKARRTFLT